MLFVFQSVGIKLHSKHLSRLMMLQVLFKRSDLNTGVIWKEREKKKHNTDLVT